MSTIIYNAVSLIFYVFEVAILIECVASFVPQARNNSYIETIERMTYPILEPFRRIQYKLFGNIGIDFSPIFALTAMRALQNIILGIL